MFYSRNQKAITMDAISLPTKNPEARGLPYLQAVIKKGLFIMPPAADTFFKTIPLGSDVIAGKSVPGDTHIGSSLFGLHCCKVVLSKNLVSFGLRGGLRRCGAAGDCNRGCGLGVSLWQVLVSGEECCSDGV